MEQPDRLKKFILQDGKPIQKIWDTSSLSSFLSCPRLYNYTNLQKILNQFYRNIRSLNLLYQVMINEIIFFFLKIRFLLEI